MQAFYRLTSLPDPPLYFLLSKDPVGLMRRKVADRFADAERYASWSEGVYETS